MVWKAKKAEPVEPEPEQRFITSDEITPTICDVLRMRIADEAEFLMGRSPANPVYNIEGAALQLDAVIYRKATSQYQVCVKLGPHWYQAMQIPTGDRGIRLIADRMTVIGPSPSQIAMQEKHEANQKRSDAIQAEEHHRQREAAIARIEAAEAWERQRRAASQ